jgi:exodeoxyribonuclease VII large subunit
MDDFGPLFAPPEPEPQEPPTWSVLELNRAIEAALQQAFPEEIWLRGEIQGLGRTRMRRHWYFELVEKDPDSDQVKGKVSVALLQWNRPKVDRMMRGAPGFELDDDVEVRIRCQVGYYPPFGKLQLVMTGVDPSFTLGQMAANRERILRTLSAEGLLRANAEHELPMVPARVGLVTSVGSAAYNDFVEEIARGGYGLHVVACDARVQGADTEPTVIAALRTLVRRGCDVVVIARGGGSRSDLAGFDSEAIARAIAVSPVPVLTGIGHEIDTSVADAVAHTAFKTPTACAAFLVECARGTVDRAEAAWEGVAREALRVQRHEEQRLLQIARGIGRGARTALRHRDRDLDELHATLVREGRGAHTRAGHRLDTAIHRAAQLVRVRLAAHEARLELARRRLSPERVDRAVEQRSVRLAALTRRLAPLALRRLGREEADLKSRAQAVRALDPRRVLRRGYSLSYDDQGNLVRDPSAVSKGDGLRTVVAGGEIHGRVESTRSVPDPDPTPEDPA